MKTLTIVFLLLLSTVFISCNEKMSVDTNKIYFVQNNTIQSGSGVVYNIQLNRDEFEIHFFNKEYIREKQLLYAAQIAALPSKDELDAIKVGMQKTETTCFIPGTGMAAKENGYTALVINAEGHHYLKYTPDAINRVKKVGEKNGLHQLAFSVKAIDDKYSEAPIKSSKVKTLYLAIFIDRNLDGIINKEDLTKVTISLQ
ncbi:hypothetical protein J8281_08700 [Aquimarina sp. U1-2]|uniref:hypothetical protein n=1 Tax=Aquimarina sp. U1-2 TaxID=2823141 RepID=UPI001AECA2A5|nr:hypothetical protein [Aquimarina sp. U1-2]MBP2832263.1 hypothetical protein [Aquimarina sp. U1-2]